MSDYNYCDNCFEEIEDDEEFEVCPCCEQTEFCSKCSDSRYVNYTEWLEGSNTCKKCHNVCCTNCMETCYQCANIGENFSPDLCKKCSNYKKIPCEYHFWPMCDPCYKKADPKYPCPQCKANRNYDARHQPF